MEKQIENLNQEDNAKSQQVIQLNVALRESNQGRDKLGKELEECRSQLTAAKEMCKQLSQSKIEEEAKLREAKLNLKQREELIEEMKEKIKRADSQAMAVKNDLQLKEQQNKQMYESQKSLIQDL